MEVMSVEHKRDWGRVVGSRASDHRRSASGPPQGAPEPGCLWAESCIGQKEPYSPRKSMTSAKMPQSPKAVTSLLAAEQEGFSWSEI